MKREKLNLKGMSLKRRRYDPAQKNKKRKEGIKLSRGQALIKKLLYF